MYSKDFVDLVSRKYEELKTYGKVAECLGIKRYTVQTILKRRKVGVHKKPGPKQSIDKSSQLRIKRKFSHMEQSSQKITAKKIVEECDLNVSTRTVQRYFNRQKCKFGHIPQRITLNTTQKLNRVKALTKWIADGICWRNVVFSDEKRFSLNGPDNYMTYSSPNSIKNTNNTRRRSHSGGGSILYWGMLLPNATLHVKEVENNLNAFKYIDLLDGFAVPIITRHMDDEYMFQQDNSTSHTSKKVMEYFDDNDIQVLNWPPYSPDLNVIENMWKIMSDLIYAGKQPSNKNELRLLVEKAVSEINATHKDSINKLYDSMGRRISETLQKKGGLTKY